MSTSSVASPSVTTRRHPPLHGSKTNARHVGILHPLIIQRDSTLSGRKHSPKTRISGRHFAGRNKVHFSLNTHIFTARCTIVQSAVLRSHVVRLSVCPSVRPSVTLVDQDHIHWKSRKLIARTRSPTPSLFGAQAAPTYSQGNMGKFWGE